MRAMRAESFTGYGGLKLVEVPRPTLAAGRVLVRMMAAGVSPLDHTILSGGDPRATAPLILGNEGAGVVEDPGDSSFSAGARIMFCGPYGVSEDGTYAEWIVQKALPLMPEGGSIIVNASVVASKGLPANSVYSATKAAVRSFARTWTTDLKSRRIRVNAVSPGSIDTPALNDLLASSEVGEQRRKAITSAVPLGRFGTPDEIAKAVVFLASDDASYVTGTELFVDGGFAQV